MFQIGGKGKPAAPPAAKPRPRRAAPLVAVTVRLEAPQKAQFERLGGEAWLRQQLDAARMAAVAGGGDEDDGDGGGSGGGDGGDGGSGGGE